MTFFTLDEDDIPPDERDVLTVSAVLQITEFRLFELAYQRWFGEATSEQAIERFYAAYMFQAVVPPWVRQYCRAVLERDRAQSLDPTEFGVYPHEENLSTFQRGINYILVVSFVVVTLHLIAILIV